MGEPGALLPMGVLAGREDGQPILTNGALQVESVPVRASNPLAALILLRALVSLGLRHLVVCPGSRSAPLAVAASLLERQGLGCTTAIDERSAAFFALGLSRASGLPAGVITTSGTAVANLLPAAVEADHGTIPLLLLSADRPSRLKGCGANQSVNQEQFLTCSCRWLGQGHPDGLDRMDPSELRHLAQQAITAARGDGVGNPPGPVHLNLPFDDPLHADGSSLKALGEWLRLQAPAPQPGPAASSEGRALAVEPAASTPLDPTLPGVVLAGPWRGDPGSWEAHLEAVRGWQRLTGWPVLADALSGLRGVGDLEVVAGYELLLQDPPAGLAASQVLRLGPLPVGRNLERWLQAVQGVQILVSETDPRPLDPLAVVRQQRSGGLARWMDQLPHGLRATQPSPLSRQQAERWLRAETLVQQMLQEHLENQALAPLQADASPCAMAEPWLARGLARQLPEGLAVMLANSSPVRDWACFGGTAALPRPVFAFRGASGIDGTLSLACGLAEGLGRLVLVTGDLALLHDTNGWLWRGQLKGTLTVVLIDNGGGGIFEQLPIRTLPEEMLDFERFFAMPQAADPLELAAAHGVPARQIAHPDSLSPALAWALEQPIALLVVRTDRRRDAELRRRLRTMAVQAWDQP